MPMSPLPNSAVSLVPPPELIESVMVVVVPLSSPQAARKAATAVVLPPTARNRRRETGSLSCLISAIGRVPPGRLLAPTYGGCAPGGSESAQWPELHQLLYPADGQVDAVRNWDRGIEPGARRGAAGDRLDRLHPVRGRPGDDPLRRGRHLWGGLPSRRLRRPGAGGGDAGRLAARARVAAPRRAAARRRGRRGQPRLLRRARPPAAGDRGHARVRRPAGGRDRR